MNYKANAEANIEDAIRHLNEAMKMGQKNREEIARQTLEERINMIKNSQPDVYNKYKHHLNIKMGE